MSTDIQFLCNHKGVRVLAELPYSEYMRLTDFSREAPLVRTRLKKIIDMLEAQLSVAETPAAQSVEPAAQAADVEIVVQAAVQIADVSPVSPGPAERVLPKKPPAAVTRHNSPEENQAGLVPPMLMGFLTEQDPSEKSLRLIEACARKLSGFCEKRITLSLHKPYVCLWDFDEWKTFAFGEVINESLYISIERSLVPNASSADIWIPPYGLYKKPLVRLKVDAVTDTLLAHLKNALICQIEKAAA